MSVTSSTPEEEENTESGRKEMFDWEMKTLGRERFLWRLRLPVTSPRSVLRQARPALEISQPPSGQSAGAQTKAKETECGAD